jgi:hypothetical protein
MGTPIAVIIRLAADYGVITDSISFTYSSMARCSSRVTPAATVNSASDFTRHAIFPCQQYPSVVRGLALSHARQHVRHADMDKHHAWTPTGVASH